MSDEEIDEEIDEAIANGKYIANIFGEGSIGYCKVYSMIDVISELQKENKEKDKVIDKMAEYIEDISKDTEVPVHKQAIIDFYYKQVKE